MENKQPNEYLDVGLLKDYFDRLGKSIVEQMLTLYCQQAEIYLSDIESAQLSDSQSDWESHCHKMKGAAASIGMVQLHGQLKRVEKITVEKSEKAALLKELTLLNQQSIFAFKSWLETL